MFVIPRVERPSDIWSGVDWGPNNFIIPGSPPVFSGSLAYLNGYAGSIYAGTSMSVGIPYSVLLANGLNVGDLITVSGTYVIHSIKECRTFSVRLNYNYTVSLPVVCGGGSFSISGVLQAVAGFWFHTSWPGNRAGHLVFDITSVNIYKTANPCPISLEI